MILSHFKSDMHATGILRVGDRRRDGPHGPLAINHWPLAINHWPLAIVQIRETSRNGSEKQAGINHRSEDDAALVFVPWLAAARLAMTYSQVHPFYIEVFMPTTDAPPLPVNPSPAACLPPSSPAWHGHNRTAVRYICPQDVDDPGEAE
ncbi:hypothetical protein CH63R_03903 [Colletotrichum higginsianum IMI 349063]|uniref:Uncharacterized protein n=1 Tax=Colletotrichum higginsianum (strain IMI 349063) TaxID=759273 RepID=A0A1B7YHP2_COLHI|nr:hypothetical protein CH63R_03903 [Colletotrichum higginsianum IMI 349063]OBR11607.1 hypothetical protein CH63R_03903 [Colletotrichum higginsianum IMI 349063]